MNWNILLLPQNKTRTAFSRFATVKYMEMLLGEPKTFSISLPGNQGTSQRAALEFGFCFGVVLGVYYIAGSGRAGVPRLRSTVRCPVEA